ncbi:NAD(P)H-dependent oxidoreductase subunit E [Soehngenia longivitae]|uniref:NAD(P)H-dependent oxidoreductase subunit E n=1 Tax=Soehngenia longivitae TaxID=2562294 RepID=A0A4Z0D7C4_9FIRM|nr:NAD(P)H-dependent oxidoreductase subunit E [Soehngenia longivitae]TFZ40783.1 NAD(P)H-dependent oxidoreductase subunit E [Soehngenia longivitae]
MYSINEIDEIISSHGNDQSSIIAILHDVQSKYNYIPEDCLEYISNKLDISPTKAFGIVTFYENFSLEPKGRYIIKICDGTACHVRKSTPILEALKKELKLTDGKKTTDDLMFTLETVSCLGACGLAPVITINDKVYGKMTPEHVVELLNSLKEEK